MSRLTTDILEQISNHVQGTCHSLEQQATDILEEISLEYDDLTFAEQDQVIEYVEQRHFMCAKCGWWNEAGDYAEYQPDPDNGDICTSCGEDYVEDEE